MIGCLNCDAPQDAAWGRRYVVPPQFRPRYAELPGLGFCGRTDPDVFFAGRHPTTCFDTDNGAKDKDGYNCAAYTQIGESIRSCDDLPSHLANRCRCDGKYDDDGFTAHDVCCFCGGGEHVGQSLTTETHCVDTNDMEEAKAACLA